ncbi:MAG: hypothetical protein AAF497_06265 [Planctomycetota bacterium]
MKRWPIILLTLVLACHLATTTVCAEPAVHLTIATPKGASPRIHDWIRTLKKMPLESVRTLNYGSSAPAISTTGNEDNLSIQIRGVINSNDELVVPGGKFSLNSPDRFGRWLEKLVAAKTANVADTSETDGRHAFGLTARQLVGLSDALSKPVESSTKGQPVVKVLKELNRLVDPRMRLAMSGKGKITPDDVVTEELQGVAAGTATAAILRPLGLVLVPKPLSDVEGDVELMVMDVRQSKENWPVGWPADKQSKQLLPKWHDFLEVEIDNVSLSRALDSLQPRLKIAFLMDQNGMARKSIDPTQKLVSFPSKKTFYGRIIKNLLFQSKLAGELRVDEAGKPFLWVSTR